MTTATKEKITFVSKRHDKRFVISPQISEKRDAMNRVMVDGVPAKDIVFHANHYETDDPDEIKFLRNHDLFNNPDHGFYELGNAPDEPRPTIAEQIDAIAEASATGDAALLGALLKQEEKTHNRPPIVASARKALARIQGADTASEAEADDAGETAEAEEKTK